MWTTVLLSSLLERIKSLYFPAGIIEKQTERLQLLLTKFLILHVQKMSDR